MPYIAVRGRVEDYGQWKRGFEENAARRRAGGLKSEHVLRDPEDPHELVIVFEADDVEQARQYLQSAPSREARQRQGVTREAIYLP